VTRQKRRRATNQTKGYTSAFDHFSVHDEEILGKCCSEVSKTLQEIFSQRDRKKCETKSDYQNKVVFFSDEEGISPLKNSCVIKPYHTIGETREELSAEQSTESDSMGYIPEPRRRDSAARRSSVGQLAHFVKRNSVKDKTEDHDFNSATHYKGIRESIQTFQFRSQNSEKLQQREMERRQGNTAYLLAQTKRKRMTDYGQQILE